MTEHNVLRADEERRQFMIDADSEGLRQRLSPELIWTHSSGVVEDRESFIQAIVHKRVRYLSLDTKEVSVRELGGHWMLAGIVIGEAERDGQIKALRSRFLSLWGEESGVLKMIAWQSTNIA